MLLRIFTEPQQGATYDSLLATARTSESLGFDAFFRSDHYRSMGTASGLPGPSDAWTTLAGIARETSTIRLGTLVTSATFRPPGPLAVIVAGVDAMAGVGWSWARCRLVRGGAHRLRHPLPAPGRALRAPGGAAGPHHRPVGDTRREPPSPGRGPTTGWWTARPSPSRCSGPGPRSSWVATAPAAPPGWPPPTRPSSTWLSRPSTRPAPSSSGCGPPAGGGGVIPDRWPSRRPR